MFMPEFRAFVMYVVTQSGTGALELHHAALETRKTTEIPIFYLSKPRMAHQPLCRPLLVIENKCIPPE